MKIPRKIIAAAIIVPAFILTSAAAVSTDDYQVFAPIIQASSQQNALAFSGISDNRSSYPDDHIPLYKRIEITFQISGTTAGNPQFPYDPSPPNGIDPTDPAYQGISVDGLFSPDNWQTVYRQPAFYYQHFDEDLIQIGSSRTMEWYLPTDSYAWKVRFSPNQTGIWQYKLEARDASGFGESQPMSFEVVGSDEDGFIKVSENDRRYFEFDNGELFFPLGVNGDGYLEDPVVRNEPLFQNYNQNGINLKRIWISEMYGTSWLEWLGGRNLYNAYLPRPGIIPFYDSIRQRYTLTQRLDYEIDGNKGWFGACRFQFWNNPEAVKPGTNYRLRISYWGSGISGPRIASAGNYGLVGKIGGQWEPDCFEPGTSSVVTEYGHSTTDWNTIEGTWYSGNNTFVPKIYVGLENVTEGRVYVESISLREDLGNGRFGPEMIAEPSMAYERYFPEQEAYAMDKTIELAEKYGVYLKLVIHEKGDNIFIKFNDDGTYAVNSDNEDGFYGIGRGVNKTRWLQQAWWRYLQARWGYSTAVHSWELTNEGNPGNLNHFALADELGKFMHCQVFGIPVGSGDGKPCNYDHPNDHLVTTSFWHSLPSGPFWVNPDYPNIDYADLHAYVSTGFLPDNPQYEIDAALFHLDYSRAARNNLNRHAEENGVPTKPIIRGETGIDFLNEQRENPDLALDLNGVWLHNLLWAGLDPGAMSELYWWPYIIDQQPGPDGIDGLYEVFGYLSDFVEDIPLSNGNYQDAEAVLTDPELRAAGQKDVVNGRAHLWIQNRNHTWRNVVDGAAGITGLSGTATLAGFNPQHSYDVVWYEFRTQGLPSIRMSSVTSTGNGEIILDLPADQSIGDVAIKISG